MPKIQAETVQDSARRDAQILFDARRDSERRDTFEQNVTDRQQASGLEQANQNLEAFAYTVSHDLRAPLRAMNGFSEALLEEYGSTLGEKGRGYAERIQAASEHMSQLIDALLHLARISRSEVHLRPVDLGAEAIAIAAELEAAEPGRSVRFTIQRPSWALADRVADPHRPGEPAQQRLEIHRRPGRPVDRTMEHAGRGHPHALLYP